MKSIITSIRLVIITLLIVVVGYSALILGLAQGLRPETANGSLVTSSDGKIIGSRLIAQKFSQAGYFWPRPSAPDYNASAAAGSNKSPTSRDLSDRAAKTVAEYAATPARPLPAELAAASGGGLDPHITEHGAIYQADRIAKARSLPLSQVQGLIQQLAFSPGGFLSEGRLVNVLELNLALDSKISR